MENANNIFSEFGSALIQEKEDQELESEIKGFHTLDFELSWEQLSAIKKIIKFINNKNISNKDNTDNNKLLLSGKAGTGKTSVISQVIAYLDNHSYDYVVCAPTHKARINLEKLTKTETLTLHQLLLLKPNLEIEQLNIKELEFQSGLKYNWKARIPRLVIVDECSMITSDLYEFIDKELVSKRNVKIVFLGDSAQLRGVKDLEISKVFSLKNKIELTKIYRQKDEAPLLYLLDELRTSPHFGRFKEFKSNYGSLYNCNNVKDFIIEAGKNFKKAISKEDPYLCRILTYTNKRLNEYNTVLNKLLFNNNEEYNIGGFLTGYDNFESDDYFGKIYNSLDYIIKDVKPYIKPPSQIFPLELKGFILTLRDFIYEDDIEVFIISKYIDPEILNSFISLFETTRLTALKVDKKVNSRLYGVLWSKYYKLQQYFASPIDLYYDGRLIKSATLKPGYAISTHKSQGSSITNVYIDMKDILRCKDEEELRQLQYVALSRTKNNIYLLN